ncbi:hypothetical protein K439DRAFT_1628346 [Ramaria rubella]|nr:hypothetical protein K439DRAFT_1628346 [Ramaria rubella]
MPAGETESSQIWLTVLSIWAAIQVLWHKIAGLRVFAGAFWRPRCMLCQDNETQLMRQLQLQQLYWLVQTGTQK